MPDIQEIALGGVRLGHAFNAREPDDPYRLMVEAFADAALAGERRREAPLPFAESLGTLLVTDRLRAGMEALRGTHLTVMAPTLRREARE